MASTSQKIDGDASLQTHSNARLRKRGDSSDQNTTSPTGKDKTVYAVVPRSDIENNRSSWAGHHPVRGSKVELLGHGPISWMGKGGRIRTGAPPAEKAAKEEDSHENRSKRSNAKK